jgi:SAM-dependent MidA family methyltransferase
VRQLRKRILQEGPLPFSEIVREALYGETGFYTLGGGAGQQRDFVTSPEVGPLFGAVIANALDSWWAELGKPNPFVVADCGAGPGALASAILSAKPMCAYALRLLLVDTSPVMRDAQRRRRLPLVEPHEFFDAELFSSNNDHCGVYDGVTVSTSDRVVDSHDSRETFPPIGPRCLSMDHLPEVDLHIVFANELLDNLAFDIVSRRRGKWFDVRVGLGASSTELCEIAVVSDQPRADLLTDLLREHMYTEDSSNLDLKNRNDTGPDREVRVPVLVDAHRWLADVRSRVVSGCRIVCIDYGGTTRELADRNGSWLRTYRAQERGFDPLADLGFRDITIDVPFDQLVTPNMIRSQSDFLLANGINALIDEAKRTWEGTRTTGSLASLQAKSAIFEAETLCDSAGLGAFCVAEWIAT